MRSFLAAIGFLTILPLPGGVVINSGDHAKSVFYYPVTGALIGVTLVVLDLLISSLLPQAPSAAIAVIAMFMVSGGLHMDGLSDTCDAFFSGRNRERMLEIMKDSSAGPFGILAIVSLLLVKFTALDAVAPAERWMALFLAPMAGRCAMAISIALFPYVSPATGLGNAFEGAVTSRHAVWSAMFALVIGLVIFGAVGAGVWVSLIAVTFVFSYYSIYKVGGMTGDTYGALCEITEAAALLTVAGMLTGSAG